MFNRNDLAMRGTISGMVKAYETETARIREAYASLKTASENLTQAMGKESAYSSIDTLPRGVYSYNDTCETVLKGIKVSVWKRLVEQLGIRRVLSEARNRELDSKLNSPDNLPDLTVENIYQMFELLMENVNGFAREAITEVYDRLHRPNSHYKTNQRNAFEDLGKKVILGWMIERGYGDNPFRVRYQMDSTLISVDKVFHNLDGAPFMDAGYRSPLVDAINTSPDGTGETEYFRFKCYGNGNLHLEFTRPDLLKDFNQIANDGTRLKSGVQF